MATVQQQVSTGAALAGSTTTALLSTLGIAAAGGPIGLAIGGAVVTIQLLSGEISHLITGCGDACVQATQIVNQAETYVKGIADAYWQTPVRTKSFQAWTLQQLDSIFDQVRTLCGKIGGDPGFKCVQERLTRGFRPPWCSDSSIPLSQCGGWYDVTYDPIASDASVQPDPPKGLAGGVAALGHIFGGGSYATTVLVVLGILAFIGWKVRTA